MLKSLPLALVLLLGFSNTQPSFAALHDRGGGLIYDDVLNITWLEDANYAKTSGYDADGSMTWNQAVAWADNLSYFDSVRGVTYDDWRLPNIRPVNGVGFNDYYMTNGTSDYGYNISAPGSAFPGTTASELAYMYYINLGLMGWYSPSGSMRTDWGIFGNGTLNGTNTRYRSQNDVGLIDNLQADSYWSGVEVPSNTFSAWAFSMGNGMQWPASKDFHLNVVYAWAVRPGDVTAPVPQIGAVSPTFLGTPGSGNFSFAFGVHDANGVAMLVSQGVFGQPGFLLPDAIMQLFNVEYSGTFEGPLQLSFNYDPSLLPEGFDEANLRVFHWTGTEWENLGGVVDAANNTITVTTNSLSPFAVAAVPEPETYALMLAGLGLVGFAARRRKSA